MVNNYIEIDFSTQGAVEAIRSRSQRESASHAFASLYIWQEEMGLTLHLEEDVFSVRCGARGEDAWFFPCGERAALCQRIQEMLKRGPLTFCYMQEEDVALLKAVFPGQFVFTKQEADSEYLYSRKQQQEMRGRGFSAMRNQIYGLDQFGTFSCEALCEGNVEKALQVARRGSLHTKSHGLTGTDAGQRLLQNWQQLGASGLLVLLDGEPCAVAAGYPLSEDTFDLALVNETHRLPGLLLFARYRLICGLPARYTQLNAEEDLGKEGLRAMKLQMRPTGMIEMYEGRSVANA